MKCPHAHTGPLRHSGAEEPSSRLERADSRHSPGRQSRSPASWYGWACARPLLPGAEVESRRAAEALMKHKWDICVPEFSKPWKANFAKSLCTAVRGTHLQPGCREHQRPLSVPHPPPPAALFRDSFHCVSGCRHGACMSFPDWVHQEKMYVCVCMRVQRPPSLSTFVLVPKDLDVLLHPQPDPWAVEGVESYTLVCNYWWASQRGWPANPESLGFLGLPILGSMHLAAISPSGHLQ